MFGALILSLTFCFFFSGIEMAFLSADKLHIELQRKAGRWDARLLARLIHKPAHFLSTLLIGNTLALVYYGYLMTALLKPWLIAHFPWILDQKILLLITQSLVSTTIVLIIAEFTPKNLFLIRPNMFLSIFALPAYVLNLLFYPVVRLASLFSSFFLRRFLGLSYTEKQRGFQLSDLSQYVQRLTGKESEKEVVNTRFFDNALDFKAVRIRHCMVPRTEIVAVEVAQAAKVLRERFLNSGHSRILIYKGTIDNVLGYYPYKVLIENLTMGGAKTTMRTLVKQHPVLAIPIVTETASAKQVLLQLIAEKKSIALVVDEYGGTAGIVTIEDMIEEIFGEIHDEYDEIDKVEQTLDENHYSFSARLEIDYLNEKYELGLPTGEYDTLGGLILDVCEQIPQKGDLIQIGRANIKIVSMKKSRIDMVDLTLEDETT